MRIYCDIDGVLADCSHRLKYINHKKKDYNKFYDPELVAQDKPMYRARVLLENAQEIILVSGRREECREITRQWLDDNFDISPIAKAQMELRQKGDLRPSPVIKAETIKRLEKKSIRDFFTFFIDDNQENINAVRKVCPYIVGIKWNEIKNNINA